MKYALNVLMIACATRGAIACTDTVHDTLPVVDASTTQDTGAPVDSGADVLLVDGSAADAGEADCVQNPRTHLEIINACTTAVKVDKRPVLPKLQADGGLPPLP